MLMMRREKLDALSRKLYNNGDLRFISDVSLILIDEVHLLCEDRGPTLEAGVVCRLKALGNMPQMQNTNVAHLRLMAVSATIPNIRDISTWLGISERGCKEYGEEMRPVQIQTIVRGFPAAKNDFLFEKRLNEKVFQVIQEHWGHKPVLAFCSSRKGVVSVSLFKRRLLVSGSRLYCYSVQSQLLGASRLPQIHVSPGNHPFGLLESACFTFDHPYTVPHLHVSYIAEAHAADAQLFICVALKRNAGSSLLADAVDCPCRYSGVCAAGARRQGTHGLTRLQLFCAQCRANASA